MHGLHLIPDSHKQLELETGSGNETRDQYTCTWVFRVLSRIFSLEEKILKGMVGGGLQS